MAFATKEQNQETRVSFFGGKGGVGKTTCSTAYALMLAEAGVRTLLISTDPAHSLADLLDVKGSGKPRPFQDNLWIHEIDNESAAKKYIANVKQQLKRAASPDLWQEVERQIELAALSPGAAEAALFDEMAKLILEAEGVYEHLIFDTAPTGHTLRLFTLPELMNTWIETMVRRRESFQKKNQMLENIAGVKETQTDIIYQMLLKRKNQFSELRDILYHPELSKFYFVLNPEKLAIRETEKAVQQLESHRIAIGGFIVNRVLPHDVEGRFLTERRKQEAVYLRDIDKRFKQYRRVKVPMFSRDVIHVDQLVKLASKMRALFQSSNRNEVSSKW